MPCLKVGKKRLSATGKSWKRLCSAIGSGLRALACTKPVGWLRSVVLYEWRTKREVRWTRMARRVYEPARSDVEAQQSWFETVYVDELVGGGYVAGEAEAGSSSERVVIKNESRPSKVERRKGLGSALRVCPQVVWAEVDERAEEFIQRFRGEMRLQRERSIEEFKEMLARGAR